MTDPTTLAQQMQTNQEHFSSDLERTEHQLRYLQDLTARLERMKGWL